jgi:hypothetical protein
MTAELDISRLDELSALAVPDWAHGVWQRTAIRAGGDEDTASTVIWIQTPTLYADIRVPAPGETSPLAGEEGFAGYVDIDRQVCRWQRPVDLNPGPEGADQGAMFRDGELLVEVGLLANYYEDYRLIDPAKHCFAASRGAFTVEGGRVKFSPDGPLDILVAAGPYVTHARRNGTSALRHGRLAAGTVTFDLAVGDPKVFEGGEGTWTVWTDTILGAERDMLLAALRSKALTPGT